MIGNDLVDLATARKESNWKRKGFLEKIFTDAEQLLIQNASQPETMVWILWSMKESAYKIWNRSSGVRLFNPKSFECAVDHAAENSIHGKVRFGALLYHSQSIHNNEFVHTICRTSGYRNTSLYVRFTDSRERIDLKNAIVRNPSGIPCCTNINREKELISISHHGNLCSYLSTFKLE